MRTVGDLLGSGHVEPAGSAVPLTFQASLAAPVEVEPLPETEPQHSLREQLKEWFNATRSRWLRNYTTLEIHTPRDNRCANVLVADWWASARLADVVRARSHR